MPNNQTQRAVAKSLMVGDNQAWKATKLDTNERGTIYETGTEMTSKGYAYVARYWDTIIATYQPSACAPKLYLSTHGFTSITTKRLLDNLARVFDLPVSFKHSKRDDEILVVWEGREHAFPHSDSLEFERTSAGWMLKSCLTITRKQADLEAKRQAWLARSKGNRARRAIDSYMQERAYLERCLER